LRVAGGGVLATLGALYPGLGSALSQKNSIAGASTSATAVMPSGPDVTYAGGEVTAIAAGGVVLTTPTTSRAVRLNPETVVWKEVLGSSGLIELGDWVDVRGEPQVDGSLLATSGMVFVNIGRRDGVLVSSSANHITVSGDGDGDGADITYGLSASFEVVNASDGTPLAGGLASLEPGVSIGMVGLRLPGGGFRPTRIWA